MIPLKQANCTSTCGLFDVGEIASPKIAPSAEKERFIEATRLFIEGGALVYAYSMALTNAVTWESAVRKNMGAVAKKFTCFCQDCIHILGWDTHRISW